MERLLTFVVPLRSPQSSKNWQNVLKRLMETAYSIEAACNYTTGLNAILVANNEAELPVLPRCFEVIRVNLAPPNVSVFKGDSADEQRRNAVWWDKGFKVASGMRFARQSGSRFLMSVDADDLVSRRIGELPYTDPNADGWYINKGWLLPVGSRWGIALSDFHNWCGTYAIVRGDHLPLETPVESLALDDVKRIFGHHREMLPMLRSRGIVLKEAGFRAAVYSVAHSESNYGRGGLRTELLAPRKLVTNPIEYFKWLLKLRYFGTNARVEFSGF